MTPTARRIGSFIRGLTISTSLLLAACSSTSRTSEDSDHFAVIVGMNSAPRHVGNISLAYQVLLEEGYGRNDVQIFDTTEQGPVFPQEGLTSRLRLQVLFDQLAIEVGPRDTLLVYITGHGVREDGVSYLVLTQDDWMPSQEFKHMLGMVQPGYGLLLADQCYGGQSLVPEGCGWTTVTVATDTTPSKDATFPRAFWDSFRHGARSVREAFDRARADDVNTRDGPNLPQLFVGSCADPNLGLLMYK